MTAIIAEPSTPRESTEEDPLLLAPEESDLADSSPPQRKEKPWRVLVAFVLVLIAVVDVGTFLAEPPKTRVFEANICLTHYQQFDPSVIRDGVVPEALCKIDAVQQKMAMIFGWQDMFDAIPGILLAVPFGALADIAGRKWIVAGSLIGLQLSSAWVLIICYFKTLPLQLTWLSSVFYLFGGGPIVASAIGVTMISDIVPPERRTAIFLYLTASVLLAEIIAPILAAKLMEIGDWTPLLLALCFQQLGIFIAVFFPETLHLRDVHEDGDLDEDDDESIVIEKKKHSEFTIRGQLKHFRETFLFLKRDWTLALVIFSFMANRLGRQAITLIVRYASKRYTWPIKKAAYLLSFRAATNLVAITVIIPLISLLLLKYYRLPGHSADLWIARGSIVLTTTSMLIIGVASHPVLLIIGLMVFNLGTGYNAAMRSISIYVIGGQSSPDVGKLMSTIAIVESFGIMLAGPLLNKMLQWGMSMGGAWVGLPFFGAMTVFACMTIVTYAISVKGKGAAYVPVPTSEDEEAGETGSTTPSLERGMMSLLPDDGPITPLMEHGATVRHTD